MNGIGGGLIALVIIVIIALVIIVNCVKIVPQAHAMVIERLGGYLTTWSVGLHFKVPFIDRIARKVLLKEQVVDFPPQPVITKDNVTMQIDTVVYFQITDPKLYAYGVGNSAPNELNNKMNNPAKINTVISELATVRFFSYFGKKYESISGSTKRFTKNVITYSTIPTTSRISINFLIRNHCKLPCLFIYFSKRYPSPRMVRIYADGSSSSFPRSLLMHTIILLSATM